MPKTLSARSYAKARYLATLIETFPRGRYKADGRGFRLIPGSELDEEGRPKVAHYANNLTCTCEGFRRHGICTHQVACSIYAREWWARRLAEKGVS